MSVGAGRGRWGAKLVLGGLVALNVVLLVLIWRTQPLIATPSAAYPPPGADSSPAGDPPSAIETPESPATAEPSPTPTARQGPSHAEDTPSRVPPERQATRLLAVNSAQVAWRATITECGSRGSVEVTSNGGRRWRETDPGLPVVLRLKSYAGRAVFAVGADGRCRGRYRTTDSPAGRWRSDPGMLAETWHRDPEHRNTVVAPAGERSKPCPSGVADVAGLGTFNASALCANGSVALTGDGGKQWRAVQPELDVLALNADDLGFVAAGRSPSCSGIAVVLFGPDGEGLSRDTGRCAPVGVEATASVAVAVRGDVVWIWADDRVVTSSDGGRSW